MLNDKVKELFEEFREHFEKKFESALLSGAIPEDLNTYYGHVVVARVALQAAANDFKCVGYKDFQKNLLKVI